MRFFELDIDKLILRYYLMMALIIGGLFAGQPIIGLLGLPVFLSTVLGVSFMPEQKETAVMKMKNDSKMKKQAA